MWYLLPFIEWRDLGPRLQADLELGYLDMKDEIDLQQSSLLNYGRMMSESREVPATGKVVA